jgi:hypothetical protein
LFREDFFFLFFSLVFFSILFSPNSLNFFLILTFEFIYFIAFRNFTVHWNTS